MRDLLAFWEYESAIRFPKCFCSRTLTSQLFISSLPPHSVSFLTESLITLSSNPSPLFKSLFHPSFFAKPIVFHWLGFHNFHLLPFYHIDEYTASYNVHGNANLPQIRSWHLASHMFWHTPHLEGIQWLKETLLLNLSQKFDTLFYFHCVWCDHKWHRLASSDCTFDKFVNRA